MTSEVQARKRDLIGYGRRPPKVVWPNGAKVAVNLVINYEEGSEHYERGETLYAQGDYEGAVLELVYGYCLAPTYYTLRLNLHY